MHVVHISGSALAGAPGMLSEALEAYGEVSSSMHFRGGDYGPERNLMSPNSVPVADNERDRELFLNFYRRADVVHVHNFIPMFIMRWMSSVGRSGKKLIYQVHSPRYERPLFDDLSVGHGFRFDDRLVICHFHPRQFSDFTIVPNCLYRRHYLETNKVTKPTGSLVIHYSPSTKARGRWTEKTSEAFSRVVDNINDEHMLHLDVFNGVAPQALALYRSWADVTIDEVVTGSFHLVSYEGMAAGTAVVNGADDFAMATFRMGFKSPPPPFVRVSTSNLLETLLRLARDRDELHDLKLRSRQFFDEWMNPARVSRIYSAIYKR
jgi:hypothetical protein